MILLFVIRNTYQKQLYQHVIFWVPVKDPFEAAKTDGAEEELGIGYCDHYKFEV